MKYKVLIVDDHWLVREGLKLILETDDRLQAVGEAENGEIALSLMSELQPDIILLDLNMPVLGGLETMKRMKERAIKIPVIILTTYNEDKLMVDSLAYGANGYLLKDTSREHLIRTIDSALRGDTLLQPEIMERVFRARIATDASPARKDPLQLTDKEVHILRAVAKGFRSKEIAGDIGISERTVKAHLTNIYNKLGVDSRSQAVALAIEKGILQQ
ncbi:response regulator [Paenibacillus luteus]|uniref:response regulator n=1 Tax=Paenibacillus luteus TaxID=2545753 RepID=UPI0011411ACD|nr:response regulator transcription factor [Paenibacillus luteus]